MAFTKKPAPVAAPEPTKFADPVASSAPAEPTAPELTAPAAPAAPAVAEDCAPPVSPVIGTQFMELISRDAAGNQIIALQIGQRGVVVVIGLASIFIPGADIVDRGNGKQIV